MSIESLIEGLRSREQDRECLAWLEDLPAQEARYGDLVPPLPAPLIACLRGQNIERLYSHQARAVTLLRSGQNVGVFTPTASGKTLIYNLPFLEMLLKGEDGHGLYLFPTKALAQDQLKSLRDFTVPLGKVLKFTAAVYDGDTPTAEREKVRKKPPTALLTNPDMLHLGMLPHHAAWSAFFSKLRWVVIDEVHTYKGIFGSHVALILRRLQRVCRSYGSRPQFITSSATVGRPKEFLETLTDRPFTVVTESGAPRSRRIFLLWNPLGSPYTDATRLFDECLREGLKTIVFTRARKITELISMWVKERPEWREKVESYRAGYLPEDRREIERRLFSNELLGVVSTSALELGIDVGALDACILAGYPGTMVSTWQRVGRVGRRGRAALLILVALPDALDQFWMKHPRAFFDRPLEEIIIHPQNTVLMAQHLICAAAELPLQKDEPLAQGEAAVVVRTLEQEGKLVRYQDWDRWLSSVKNPHRDVNIRSMGEPFPLVLRETGEFMGTQDGARVYRECHPGAIYLHQGETYQVLDLDLVQRVIFLTGADVDYYTQPTVSEEIEVLSVKERRPLGRDAELCFGWVRVTERVVASERHRTTDGSIISMHPLSLPPYVFETECAWIAFAPAVVDDLIARQIDPAGGLHAMEHSLIAVMPMFVLCDRWDIGGVSYLVHPALQRPAVFIYDGTPGGAGLTRRAYHLLEAIAAQSRAMVRDCPCETGCPSCIQSPKCGNGNRPLSKEGALLLLDLLPAPPVSSPRMEKAPVKPPAPSEKPPTRSSDPPPTGPAAPAPGPQRNAPAEDALSGKRVLYFDLETQKLANEVGGWGHIRDMGLAIAVIWDSRDRVFTSYGEADVRPLIEKLRSADLIVGFNVIRFDYEVLRAYTDFDMLSLPTFDILDQVKERLGFRLKLDHLAECTLGSKKSADGVLSVQWYKEGKLDLIRQYCEQDVAITRDLFEFGVRNGYLVYADRNSGQKLRLLFDVKI